MVVLAAQVGQERVHPWSPFAMAAGYALAAARLPTGVYVKSQARCSASLEGQAVAVVRALEQAGA